MAEKFGLNFTIVDSAQLNQLRRSHGSAANPFRVYPLTIVSLSWLRGAKAERLLHEVTEADGDKRPFDLLILDEAHHVAPAAPKQRYAVDSQQTKLIRWLAPHFEHRLFLSATPHNGYPESFTALLEIIDDQRFARGVDPDPVAQKDTVIRRMKSQITEADGVTPRFAKRHAQAITVVYPDTERQAHALLNEFAALRRRRLTTRRGRASVDLVTLLLKKRLFSSPRAFAHTVGVYLETVQSRTTKKPAAHQRRGARMDGGLPRRRRDLRRRRARRGRGRRRLPVGPHPGRADRHLRAGNRSPQADGAMGGAVRDHAGRQGQGAHHLPRRRLPPRRPALDQRARRGVHRIPRHPDLAEGTARPGRTVRRAGQAALRRDGYPAAGAAQAGVPGTARPEPGPHPARHRRGQRGHRPARALPPAGQLRHPVQPEQAGAADRPHRPVRPAGDPAGQALHRPGLGDEQQLLRGRPGVPRPGRGQGGQDGRGPRHGQRGPRRRRAEADARRDRRLRRGERGGSRGKAAPAGNGPGHRRRQRVSPGGQAPSRPGRHRGRAEDHPRPRQAPGRHRPRTRPRAAAEAVPRRTRTRRGPVRGPGPDQVLGPGHRRPAGEARTRRPGAPAAAHHLRRRPRPGDGTTSCSLTSAIRWSTCRPGCCAPRCGAARPACTG